MVVRGAASSRPGTAAGYSMKTRRFFCCARANPAGSRAVRPRRIVVRQQQDGGAWCGILDRRVGRLEARIASLAQGDIQVVLRGATECQGCSALFRGCGTIGAKKQGGTQEKKRSGRGHVRLKSHPTRSPTALHDQRMMKRPPADKRWAGDCERRSPGLKAATRNPKLRACFGRRSTKN